MQKNLLIIFFVIGMFVFPGLFHRAYAETEIGQPAPVLVGKALDGSSFDLSTMRGRVVIVHFWATWCPSCREEMGVLDAFYRAHHAEGLDLIAVSIDKPRRRDEVTDVMKPFAFPAAMIDDVTDNGFGSPQSLPVTYIIDRKGILRARLTPDDQLLTPEILASKAGILLNAPQNVK